MFSFQHQHYAHYRPSQPQDSLSHGIVHRHPGLVYQGQQILTTHDILLLIAGHRDLPWYHLERKARSEGTEAFLQDSGGHLLDKADLLLHLHTPYLGPPDLLLGIIGCLQNAREILINGEVIREIENVLRPNKPVEIENVLRPNKPVEIENVLRPNKPVEIDRWRKVKKRKVPR